MCRVKKKKGKKDITISTNVNYKPPVFSSYIYSCISWNSLIRKTYSINFAERSFGENGRDIFNQILLINSVAVVWQFQRICIMTKDWRLSETNSQGFSIRSAAMSRSCSLSHTVILRLFISRITYVILWYVTGLLFHELWLRIH